MNKISIVIPCFNEEEALPVYYEEMSRIMKQMQGVDFELLFVDDGSSDRTLGIMKSLHERDERCKYYRFQEILEKRRRFMRDLAMQRGIMWQLWMWIYRIRRVCCPRCIELLLKSRTTVWRQSGLHGQGSQKSVPFYPIVFINLSIRFPRQRL